MVQIVRRSVVFEQRADRERVEKGEKVLDLVAFQKCFQIHNEHVTSGSVRPTVSPQLRNISKRLQESSQKQKDILSKL